MFWGFGVWGLGFRVYQDAVGVCKGLGLMRFRV